MKTEQSAFFNADGFNKCNKIMLSCAIVLIVVGIVFVFSADNSNISFSSKGIKQIIFSLLAVIPAVFFTILDHRKTASENFLKAALIFFLVLLIPLAFCGAYYKITEKFRPTYVTLKNGTQKAVGKEIPLKVKIAGQNFGIWRINGAYRWIILGPVNFQPSVFIKIILILFTALKLSQSAGRERTVDKLRRIKTESVGVVSPFAGVVSKNKDIIIFSLLTIILIVAQPSNSVAVSILLVLIAMFALKSTKKLTKALPLLLLGTILLFVAVWGINSNFRERIIKRGDNYQSRQALLAIGSGGVFGLGIGNGEAKYNRLPEIENDYIFAIIAEETGFVGALIFLLVYISFILAGFKTAIEADDGFSKLTAFGFTINYAFSFLFHLFVNLGFVSTGASLPFVSYGGTAVIADAVALGILLNISSSKYGRIKV
ncbi:MAG: FtsW/RodA/SpoVE family cell cycle protein [Chitinispirillales bacterium]|jgi:cell division protein FtsW|nr:FtsW/RodA/SpoVE family cell cycle protein [Chitinispirillales bacterium]